MQPTPSLVTLAIRVVQHAPCALCTLAPELKQDLSVLEAACARDPSMVKEVPTELLCDVLEAVPAVKLPLVYTHAMQCDRLKALCSSKQTTHLVLRRNALCFRSVSKAWKDDAELAHATVTSEDSTLRYVSARLRGSKAFVLKIVEDTHHIPFACVSRSLRGDRALVLAALQTTRFPTDVYRYASDRLRFDHGVLMAAMRRHGFLKYSANCPFSHAPEALRQNTALVLEAIPHSAGSVYANMMPPLRGNVEVAAYALGHGMSVYSLGSNLANDHAAMRYLIERHGKALLATNDASLTRDPVLIKTAVRTWGDALRMASESLRADRATVALAVANDGRALRFACDALRADSEIVHTAVTQNGAALQWVHPTFCNDLPTVVKAAKTCAITVHRHASPATMRAPQVLVAMLHAPNVARAHIYQQLGALTEMPMSVVEAEECSDLVAELAAKTSSEWTDVLEAAEAFVARVHAPGSSVANAHKRAYQEAFGGLES